MRRTSRAGGPPLKSDDDAVQIEKEIATLRTISIAALKERWQKLFKNSAPKYFRREFLIRAIAYQLQVEMFGGLSSETKRKLRQIAEALRDGAEPALASAPRIKPGTKLIRSWKGETHIVTALDQGFEWKRKRYESLSEVARAITGTRWNGLLFFGVKRRPAKPLRPRKKTHH
jgi:hypothetical protein